MSPVAKNDPIFTAAVDVTVPKPLDGDPIADLAGRKSANLTVSGNAVVESKGFFVRTFAGLLP